MVLLVLLAGDDLDFPTPCGKIKIPNLNCLKDKSRLLLPLHYLVKLVGAYTIAVFFVYLWVPLCDIMWGVQNLFCHDKYKKDVDAIMHADMPGYKLIEQFGEAIPQFVIAVTFYANNAHWLPSGDLQFGIFTMVMSAGSILIGVGSGCIFFIKFKIGLN